MTTRFKKLDWLLETCSEKFIKDCAFLYEMVGWMSEDDFNAFYEHVCRNWGVDSPFSETDDEMVAV